ncbi:MAG: toprim domain-containing protein, partial [bacterium]|nr:toprim domain-containing protein [bacterium]
MNNLNVFIVESPTKARTIAYILSNKNFNGKFIVKSTYGHIRDLPENSFGVDKESLEPKFVYKRNGMLLIKSLMNIKNNSHFYIATDFDREGEAIAFECVSMLKIPEN